MQQAAAFFDVDETLINIKSMFDFFDFWCREKNEHAKLQNYMTHFRAEVKKGTPREQLNREYYRQFAGVSYKELEEAGEKWFRFKLNSGLFIGSAVSALKKHQAENMYIIFISGSMLPILSPVAKYLGVKDILCAPLKFTGAGKMTGEIGYPQTIGDGKKDALIQFCEQRNINPSDCYAYGDDLSDIPMLASAGHPVCVGKHSALAGHAIKHRWPVI
ncbi:HAD-IB family hydrolase [Salmonella enterica subsp. enterica serovar Typhimurium]|uniref:HAD family hydrolase n=1 Tax=Enterobacteriaceae TaxID=543 RepID=UPI00032ED428|nr:MULTISPECIES: HAD-IB family hydrolase [Enterobacteriaceae]EBD1155424.1 HAD-IB family hydrolase [Salmonella enterica subsp. enterica serovar Uganda]EBI0198252.1 HAD-IB family hydrolase [Salmonella enterica subsp. enterica serovar Liverpool]ECU6887999.1 HAD-IB family hydrolase [Salmonella enterica subsp. enterica serovar Muenster]EDW7034244.1 HAD-IB family hydrolase [Salmonella enterica subsp. enterica serovar 4,[5],12:i:-]EEJ2831198.1 HAD-IB family hydrolase [Salmonella enterica subsp. enter